MSSSDSDLEAPMIPGITYQLPSETRILQLQLQHKIADQPSCSNKWTRCLFFAYHFLKLLSGILIIVKEKTELPWAFMISIYSFLVLVYIIIQSNVERHARKYLRMNRIMGRNIDSVKRLLVIQTASNFLTVILAIGCVGQYWWAMAILTINDAWGSGSGALGFIFANMIFESFFLVPIQLLLIIVALHELIGKIKRCRRPAQVWPEPAQRAPVAGRVSDQVQATARPRFTRRALKYSKELEGDDMCAICQVNYEEGDDLIQLPCNDKHYYHEGCMQSWFQIRRICPLCRARVQSSFVS